MYQQGFDKDMTKRSANIQCVGNEGDAAYLGNIPKQEVIYLCPNLMFADFLGAYIVIFIKANMVS